MDEVGIDSWRSSGPPTCPKEGQLELVAKLWVAPRLEMHSLSLWWQPSEQKGSFFSLNRISCISVCVHCLFFFHSVGISEKSLAPSSLAYPIRYLYTLTRSFWDVSSPGCTVSAPKTVHWCIYVVVLSSLSYFFLSFTLSLHCFILTYPIVERAQWTSVYNKAVLL